MLPSVVCRAYSFLMFQMESIGMVAVEQMFSSCAYEIGFVHSRKPFELELC